MKNDKNIKSFSIDYNWFRCKASSKNLFSSADAMAYAKWNKQFGCNNMWTFAVSYNGYAWYDSEFIPKIEGLQSNFLQESVKAGHELGMSVFSYVCLGANPRIKALKPMWSRYESDLFNMIYCDEYIDYFCSTIKEILTVSDTDGIVIDWFRGAGVARKRWKKVEANLYESLMNKPFAIATELEIKLFENKVIERAWRKIKDTVKSVRDVKIWVNQPFEIVDDPVWNDNILLKEVDYVLNESPNTDLHRWLSTQVSKDTVIVQNYCGWAGHDMDAMKVLDLSSFGKFGFAQANPATNLPYENLNELNAEEIILKDKNLNKNLKRQIKSSINIIRANILNMPKVKKIFEK